MKIILYEMKKIWNWKILGLVVLMAILFYQIFLSYSIEYFRSNHPSIEHHDLTIEMTERYGAKISKEELADFISEKKSMYELEFNTYLDTVPVFEEVGLANYEDNQKLQQKKYEELTKKEKQALEILQRDQKNSGIFRLETINSIGEWAADVEGAQSALSTYTFEMTMIYIIYVAILIILLSLILISPLVVSDRANSIHMIQYTSKNGRKILKQQLIATLVSIIILTTICLIVFGGMYLQHDILTLWNNDVNSFLNISLGEIWFKLTFGEYILLSLLFIYSLNLSVVLVAFIISRFSQNMVTMIMKLIPLFALATITFNALFHKMFSPNNVFYQITNIVGIESLLSVILLLLAIVSTLFVLRREKYIDIY